MDTLKAAQALERAGLPREQADAIAKVARELNAERRDHSELLTRSYLDVRLAKHTLVIISIFAMFVVLNGTTRNPRNSAIAAPDAAPTISVKPIGEDK